MSAPDARLRQRLSRFRKALSRLREAVDLAAERPLSRLEEQGLIQAFEFTHELAWHVLAVFLPIIHRCKKRCSTAHAHVGTAKSGPISI